RMGRSSPIARRRAAAASGLPSVPMMRSAGSPGSTRTTVKTRSETTKSVATSATARRRISSRMDGRAGRLAGAAPPRGRPRGGRRRATPWPRAVLLRPAHLREIHGRSGEILPDALDALLRGHQTRHDVKPDGRRLVGHDLLEIAVDLSPLLVVEGRLGL